MSKSKRLLGGKEWDMFKRGERLTQREAIKAQCYACTGEYDGGVGDCESDLCPLYEYMPYRKRRLPFEDA